MYGEAPYTTYRMIAELGLWEHISKHTVFPIPQYRARRPRPQNHVADDSGKERVIYVGRDYPLSEDQIHEHNVRVDNEEKERLAKYKEMKLEEEKEKKKKEEEERKKQAKEAEERRKQSEEEEQKKRHEQEEKEKQQREQEEKEKADKDKADEESVTVTPPESVSDLELEEEFNSLTPRSLKESWELIRLELEYYRSDSKDWEKGRIRKKMEAHGQRGSLRYAALLDRIRNREEEQTKQAQDIQETVKAYDKNRINEKDSYLYCDAKIQEGKAHYSKAKEIIKMHADLLSSQFAAQYRVPVVRTPRQFVALLPGQSASSSQGQVAPLPAQMPAQEKKTQSDDESEDLAIDLPQMILPILEEEQADSECDSEPDQAPDWFNLAQPPPEHFDNHLQYFKHVVHQVHMADVRAVYQQRITEATELARYDAQINTFRMLPPDLWNQYQMRRFMRNQYERLCQRSIRAHERAELDMKNARPSR